MAMTGSRPSSGRQNSMSSEMLASNILDSTKYQKRIRKELQNAVRDSILAERTLERCAKSSSLTPNDVQELERASKQWEESNAALKRVADEQSILLQLARGGAQSTNTRGLEMHPRWQRAVIDAKQGLTRQTSFSDETTKSDINAFIAQQEMALSTVKRRIHSRRQQPVLERQETSSTNVSLPIPTTESLRADERPIVRTELRPTQSCLVPQTSFDDFVKRQEAMLEKYSQQKESTTRQKQSEKRKVKRSKVTPIPADIESPMDIDDDDFLLEQKRALEHFQKEHQKQRGHSDGKQSSTSFNPDVRGHKIMEDNPPFPTTKPIIFDAPIHRQSSLSALESFANNYTSVSYIKPLVIDEEEFSQLTTSTRSGSRSHSRSNSMTRHPVMSTLQDCLGMNDQKCCLRHPNQVICQSAGYKHDKVSVCHICASENKAGAKSSQADMAKVIGDIQQLQSNKHEWREKTNIMYHGKSYVSGEFSVVSEDSTIVEEYMTDEQWTELVRLRVNQVQSWNKKNALKYNPICARYFKMLRIGVPRIAVKAECELEGKDSRILDLDPELPLKQQLDDVYCNDPKSRHSLLLGFQTTMEEKAEKSSEEILQSVIKAFSTMDAPKDKRKKLKQPPSQLRRRRRTGLQEDDEESLSSAMQVSLRKRWG